MKKEEDLGQKVTRVYEDGKWVEYEGEGWNWKRVVATAVLSIGIIGGATAMAFKDYKPSERIESKTEYKENTSQDSSYVSR
jgi:hypothetical protein